MASISLRLNVPRNAEGACLPVTGGIPFADGVLERGTPVRIVDGEGNARPTGATCLTTWNHDLRFVRWLLVDTQIDWPADEGKMLCLEVDGQEPPAPEQPVRIEGRGAGLRVDTGTLRATVGAPGVLLTGEVRGDEGWTPLFDDGAGLMLTMTDGDGNRYQSTDTPLVEVEEQTDLRVSLCLRGHHLSDDGVRLCPYILRLHFHAGSADVRVQHTFVFDQDPDRVTLTSIGVELPPPPGASPRVAIAADAGDPAVAVTGALRMLQRDDEHFEISGDAAGEGRRNAGWASLSTNGASHAALLAEPWREYPKALSAGPKGLRVDIWPPEAEPLAFSTPYRETAIRFDRTRDEAEVVRRLEENPTAPLNLKSFDVQSPADLEWVEQMVDRHAPERAASHNDTGTDDGRGAAKTTALWLRFAAGAITDDELNGWAPVVQDPPLLLADLAYAASTKAFGHFHHGGDGAFADVDAGLEQLFTSVALEPQQKGRLYGMMRYGNAVCSHSAGPAVAWVHYKDRDPVRALRHVGPYNNETNDQILGAWGQYLRTGDRDGYRFALAYARCVADVAIIHDHPDSRRVGLMHYHNAHHWTGGPSPSHTMVGGILTGYYLTGDRRLLEVATEAADWVVRTQEPAGIVSCRNAALHREFTGPLTILMEVYQATWRAEYGWLAERSLNWFLRACPRPGWYPVSVYTRGERGDEAVIEPETPPVGHARDLYALYEPALRLLPTQRLREQILAEAQYYLWEHATDNYLTAQMARRMLTDRSKLWSVDDEFYWTQWGASGDFGVQIACLAYDLTGDPLYAAYCQQHLEGTFVRQADRCRHFADWRFTWLCFGSYVPRLMGVVRDARAKDAAAVDAALADWKEKRRAHGNPVYDGPGVDLSVDTMDTNGNILNRQPVDLPREAPPRPREPVVNLGPLPVTAD